MRQFILSVVSIVLVGTSLFAQHKSDAPQTYRDICFFTLSKAGMEEFIKMQNEIWAGNLVSPINASKEMERALNKFDPSKTDRTYELWYIANYTDFDQQINVAKQSTEASLHTFRIRTKNGTARYYDKRQFLMHYLAYKAEVFYPEYWFVSIERFFSQAMVDRMKQHNAEADKLFSYSEFYLPYPPFEEMMRREEKDMKEYLGIEDRVAGTEKKALIPYTYAVLDVSAAAYILDNFKFDDATMDVRTDREVRAMKRFIQRARSGDIWLVARFDTIPFGSNAKPNAVDNKN